MNTWIRQDSKWKKRRREQAAISVAANIVVSCDVMYKSRKLPGTWCHTSDIKTQIFTTVRISNLTVDGAFKHMNQLWNWIPLIGRNLKITNYIIYLYILLYLSSLTDHLRLFRSTEHDNKLFNLVLSSLQWNMLVPRNTYNNTSKQ
jgi:hypothetical protein